MPAPYCHPLDVLRRFDPSLTLTDIQQGNILGADSVEQIQARVHAVSQDWDQDTGTPLRLRRRGSPDAPRTYEYYDADRTSGFPLRVELDHDDIVPFDPNAGDVLEIRTGRDSWDDITTGEGDEWVLLHESGDLKLFQLLVKRVWWEAPDERYLRTTYRYGALGGSRDRGGETTLAAAITGAESETTLSVTDASRLPADGGLLFLPNSPAADSEYVRATSVDHAADELTVTRAVQGTDAASHDAGTTVHYCPPDVRDAVAGQAAAELARYDLALNRTDGDSLTIDPGTKIDDWQQEYRDAKARYSSVRRM